jgi:phenylalanyl-tRNA synthetase beta chain
MPTVSVSRDRLFALLERKYTEHEFDELCFDFGLELDDVVEESATPGAAPEVMYKVEIPANRFDLLCIEGLAQALRVFLGIDVASPTITITSPAEPVTITVAPETAEVRRFIVGAVLRDMQIDENAYQSLLDLQEKLHHNICRRRTLVAIGTHDLDAVSPPFRYEAQPPADIAFVPLRPNDASYTAAELVATTYNDDAQLKKYTHILRDEPNYPVLLDSNREVLSLPPIINGHLSRISASTRNMFIECTATDLTKATIVLNTLVAMYSRYCTTPFSVEPVTVTYEADGVVMQCPDMSTPRVTADVGYINRSVGVDIAGDAMVSLLCRMQLPANFDSATDTIAVDVPVIRSDVLHACDIMNDVAIGYGFNEVPEQMPESATVGKQIPLNHLSDLVRREAFAQQGYTEVLTWVTVSNAENFDMLQRVDDGTTAVKIGNPKTLEFQECRTSLLPGLLKTLRENRKTKIPVRLFEVGDVVLKDLTAEVLASNRRKMAAVYCATSAGFEVIQGLLDQAMITLGIPKGDGTGKTWRLDDTVCTDGAFMPKRRASVVYCGVPVGTVGWIHPIVLTNFSLSYPCSAFEVDLQSFL